MYIFSLIQYFICLRKHAFDTFHLIHCRTYNFSCSLIGGIAILLIHKINSPILHRQYLNMSREMSDIDLLFDSSMRNTLKHSFFIDCYIYGDDVCTDTGIC